MKLAASLPAASPTDRPLMMAEMQRLKDRSAALNRVVMVLLLFALGAMAVARYL